MGCYTNDSIFDSKHFYTKFPTITGESYNFSLTGNTPEIYLKFQADSSLATFPFHELPNLYPRPFSSIWQHT